MAYKLTICMCLACLAFLDLVVDVNAGGAQDAPFMNAGAVPALVGRDVISTGDDDAHATVSPDGRTLYFLKGTPSFDFWAIAASEWRDNRWQPPQILPFSGRYSDADLVFAPDGHHAYFVSTRPVNGVPRTDTEIWRVEYGAEGWGEPEHVAELSSAGDEWFPAFDRDGVLYFGSSRPGGLGGHDIWRTRQVGGIFTQPENLGAPVNSTGEEIEALVTPDGALLVFAAKNRGDAVGAYDLYISRRCNGSWSSPTHPGEPVNTYAWEFGPRLSPDEKAILFTSNRGFAPEAREDAFTFEELERRVRAPYNGLRDIYVMKATSLWKHAPRCDATANAAG